MLAREVLSHILGDEALTRGLGDPEARVLVEWLVDRAERLAAEHPTPTAQEAVGVLCRRGRAIARFVALWGQDEARAAFQLAATERFVWPLPSGPVDPCELMQTILAWESSQLHQTAAA